MHMPFMVPTGDRHSFAAMPLSSNRGGRTSYVFLSFCVLQDLQENRETSVRRFEIQE
jgi:hypothetical protein